ncbi:hypothetical protein OFM36_36025, partial [Escherichia coli]|nr:hypothetical protein [Escherichia coli]
DSPVHRALRRGRDHSGRTAAVEWVRCGLSCSAPRGAAALPVDRLVVDATRLVGRVAGSPHA